MIFRQVKTKTNTLSIDCIFFWISKEICKRFPNEIPKWIRNKQSNRDKCNELINRVETHIRRLRKCHRQPCLRCPSHVSESKKQNQPNIIPTSLITTKIRHSRMFVCVCVCSMKTRSTQTWGIVSSLTTIKWDLCAPNIEKWERIRSKYELVQFIFWTIVHPLTLTASVSTTSVLSNLDKTHRFSSELFNVDHLLLILHWPLSLLSTHIHNSRATIIDTSKNSNATFTSLFWYFFFFEHAFQWISKIIFNEICWNTHSIHQTLNIYIYLNARNSILTNRDVAPLIHSRYNFPLLPQNNENRIITISMVINHSKSNRSHELQWKVSFMLLEKFTEKELSKVRMLKVSTEKWIWKVSSKRVLLPHWNIHFGKYSHLESI